MALAENEAELAGVIAHEIGHVTALHSSARQAGGFYAGLGAMAAGLFLGQTGAEVGNYLSRGLLRYSRDQNSRPIPWASATSPVPGLILRLWQRFWRKCKQTPSCKTKYLDAQKIKWNRTLSLPLILGLQLE